MSQERNVKNSILNYVETFIDKRDQERRESSSDDDDYQRKRGIDRNTVVIKEGDEDYPREKLVNIPDVLLSKIFFFFFRLGTTGININGYRC